MKQSVNIQVETNEIQRALGQEIKAIVKHDLRAEIDKTYGKYIEEIVKAHATEKNVQEIIERRVRTALSAEWWDSYSLRESADKYLKENGLK